MSSQLAQHWRNWFWGIAGRVELNLIDSSAGPAPFQLPPANLNQNKEIVLVKVSNDGNAITPIPSGSNMLSKNTALGAQYDAARYTSDGVSTWYRQ